MHLKCLLSELRQEVSHLTLKSLPPLGLDYRGRTRLERLLFTILKEYCRERFAYELGGVTSTHQRSFNEIAEEKSWDARYAKVVRRGFALCDLVRDIASSDPYAVEDALSALNATSQTLLAALEQRVGEFVSDVDDTCNEPESE